MYRGVLSAVDPSPHQAPHSAYVFVAGQSSRNEKRRRALRV